MKKEIRKMMQELWRKMWNVSVNDDIQKSGGLETGTSPRVVEHGNNNLQSMW